MGLDSWILNMFLPSSHLASKVIQDATQTTASDAIAVIFAGRGDEWKIRSDTFSRKASPTSDAWELVLLADALITRTQGELDGSRLEQLSRSDNLASEPRAVAACLSAIEFANRGLNAEAISVCESFLSDNLDSNSPLSYALVEQQASLRYLEANRFEPAHDHSQASIRILGPLMQSDGADGRAYAEVASGLWHAAIANLRILSRIAGFDPPRDSPEFDDSGFWTVTDGRVRDALSSYLEEGFESEVRGERGVRTGTSTHRIDTDLSVYALRAQLSGSWSRTREAIKLLGQEILARAKDHRSNDDVRLALALLRRSGHERSYEDAVRVTSTEGPLLALASEMAAATTRLAEQPSKASLIALRAVSALVSVERGAQIVDLLCRWTDVRMYRDGLSTFRVDDQLWRTLAAYASISPQIDAAISRAARSVLNRGDDLVSSRIDQVTSRLDWNSLPSDEQGAWRSIAIGAYRTKTSYWAGHVLTHSAGVGDEEAMATLVDSATRSPNALSIAFLLGAIDRGASDVGISYPQLIEYCVTRIEKERRDAAQGSFGFGGIDIGLLLLDLLSKWVTDSGGWTSLEEYLTDESVLLSQKSSTLDRLALATDIRLVEFGRRISRRLSRLYSTGDDSLFDFGTTASPLRLKCATAEISESDALHAFLLLATHASPSGRVEAMRSGAYVARVTGTELVLSTAIPLTADTSVDVRAEAFALIAVLADNAGGALLDESIRRIVSAFDSGGYAVPMRVLQEILRRPADSSIAAATRQAIDTLNDSTDEVAIRWWLLRAERAMRLN